MNSKNKEHNSKKVLAVASAGGHWTQLLLLSDAFTHCDIRYVTTKLNRTTAQVGKDLVTVIDADMSTKLKLIPLALQVLVIVIKYRPDVVITTGAAPGFFAVMLGKLMGAKTIWVDSMANFSELSLSGKHASKFCDLSLTQWPELADGNQINHLGSLL